MKSNKYWFRPKRFGMGAEPKTWEGWLLVIGFIGYIALISKIFLQDHMVEYFLYFSIGMFISSIAKASAAAV